MRAHQHHAASERPQETLKLSAWLMAVTFGGEFAGGLWANSVALLSDAGHVFMDLTALLFSLVALRLARWPVTDRRTFGLHRLEVFAAFLNGALVVGLAGWIFIEALGRLHTPPPVRLGPMLFVAVWGLAANVFVAWKLHGFVGQDVNMRGAFLHVITDAVASVGVVAGGIAIRFTGLAIFDPLIAILVAGMILVSAGKLLRDSVEILLEGVPQHLDLNVVIGAIRDVPGVAGVEDTHIWNICSHISSLSAHVTLPPDKLPEQKAIIDAINDILHQRFRIAHSTIQIHSSAWKPHP